jgi:hypothetical protein
MDVLAIEPLPQFTTEEFFSIEDFVACCASWQKYPNATGYQSSHVFHCNESIKSLDDCAKATVALFMFCLFCCNILFVV